MTHARARCWIHEDCLVDLELSIACGPNPLDMQVLGAGWASHDSGHDGYGLGYGNGSGGGNGWGYGNSGGSGNSDSDSVLWGNGWGCGGYGNGIGGGNGWGYGNSGGRNEGGGFVDGGQR